MQQIQRILFVPDCHHPFVDKKAWRLLLKIGQQFKPDILVTLGDFLDCFSVSAHDKDPRRKLFLDDEVEAGKRALAQLDNLGAKKKIFVAGNHEFRLARYLMQKAPELFNTVKIEDLLELKKNDWHYIPYRDSYKIGRLWVTHDTGRAGRNANNQSMDDFQSNVVIGHTHRIGYSISSNAKGSPHVGAMFGWLGNAAEADYMHRVKANRDWALGCGVGYLLPSGVVHLTPIPFVNYQVMLEGELVQ